jgi:hypothetical protein
VPLWWRNLCIGYSVQKDASRRVPYVAAAAAAAGAMSAWTGAVCPSTDPFAFLSLDVHDMGPVDCAVQTWNPNGPNQNVITFHDDAWPYPDADRTLALTTVSFDGRTGEILDADIEINEAGHDIEVIDHAGPPSVPLPGSDQVYDLQIVLTHEAGHFFGLAHSTNPDAVMFASDEGTSLKKRQLSSFDVDGICAIYPRDAIFDGSTLSGGTRHVSTFVDGSGSVPAGACDPTPHGGFTTACH